MPQMFGPSVGSEGLRTGRAVALLQEAWSFGGGTCLDPKLGYPFRSQAPRPVQQHGVGLVRLGDSIAREVARVTRQRGHSAESVPQIRRTPLLPHFAERRLERGL